MDNNLLKDLANHIEANHKNFKIHENMFDIYDGNLSKHLDQWIEGQLSSTEAAKYAKLRKSPINILRKVVDKLSSIYQQNPSRSVLNGRPMDSEILFEYEKSFKINQKMNLSNEFFNMCRSTLIQPYIHQGVARLRPIPNNKFLVYSNDQIDPTYPTHVMVCTGVDGNASVSKTIWNVWSNEEFFIMDSDGVLREKEMRSLGFEDTTNTIGRIPFVYVNRSSTSLIPPPDVDMFVMTMLIPGLLTDLNYASMFSMFSIIYGIDIDNSQLQMAPSSFWFLNSDPDTDKKPQLGTIKPEASVTETLELIKSQMAFWLQTKNIRPGTVGDTQGSSFASAISKMVDEADTTDERKKQEEFFHDAEEDLWDLITKYLHPYWVANGSIKKMPLFSPSVEIDVSFNEVIPLINRGDIVRNLQAEVDAGFISRKRAIKKLNEGFTDQDVEDLIQEIDQENSVSVLPPPDQSQDQLPQDQLPVV